MKHDDATRLRLVELRSENGPVRNVRFSPRLTLVTGFGPPEPLAAWIAAALTGPRPEGVDGLVEVAGRQVGLNDLPPTLLPPQTSVVVSDDDIVAAYRAAIEPKYHRVHARRESVSGQRAREEAARSASAARFAALESRMAELEPSLAEAIERAAADTRRAETMRKLRSKSNAYELAEAAARQPDPEALVLATEWTSLQAQRSALAEIGETKPVDAARERVAVAQRALEAARGRRATADDAARLHEAQRAVMEAERSAPEPMAGDDGSHPIDTESSGYDGAATDAARQAERTAVAQMGQTHTTLLLGLVAPRSTDDDVRTAETMLATARDELARAERLAALPAAEEIATRELDLRARAAAVLGRFPGADAAAELRAFRPAQPAFEVARDALLSAANGAAISDAPFTAENVLGRTRAWLAEQDEHPPIDHSERVVVLTESRDSVETELRAEAAELVAIAARLRDLDRTLSELATQESRVGAELAQEIDALSTDDIAGALGAVLHDFASGARTPGRLPVILGNVPSVFDGDRCDATLRLLEQASDEVQLVVLADRPAVEAWVRRLGPGASVWSPQAAEAAAAEERSAREAAERQRRDLEQRAVAEAEARARNDQAKSGPDGARAGGGEAEMQARREAEAKEQQDAEERARGGVHVASTAGVLDLAGADGDVDVRTAAERSGINLGDIEPGAGEGAAAVAAHEATAGDASAAPNAPSSDDWWIPIVSRPGSSRAARPVGEDLAQRRRRAERIAADADRRTRNGEGVVPTYCDVHRGIETTLHCTRCQLPFCDQCLAMLGEPLALHCVDCALELSGVPAHRAARRA